MHQVTVKDFPGLDLGDVRRNERFVTLIDNISRQPGSSIPCQNNSWYETKAAYNFYKNEDVTIDSLKRAIASYGINQVGSFSRLLVVHDISNISFTGLDAEGLGYLDHKQGRGILCYSSMAINCDGLPLALLHQHTWTRSIEDLGKSKQKKEKDFELKESFEWYRGITSVNGLLGSDIMKIHIADRQADIYELFFSAYEQNTELLIRAHVNRKLSDGSHLWSNITRGEPKGSIELEIPDISGKKKQAVKATVRYQQVEILRPVTSKDRYESIELTAIEVIQETGFKNEEDRIDWKLLTTMDVTSLEDVITYIKWYTYRWLIERFHYVLKSGTRIEHLQLKQATSLQKAISVYSLAAIRIMQLVYQSRQYPEASCEAVLTPAEWKTLYILTHKSNQIPAKPPSLQQAAMWIGKLGGHLGRKSDGPPGLKTVWLGYQQLHNAVLIFNLKNLGND